MIAGQKQVFVERDLPWGAGLAVPDLEQPCVGQDLRLNGLQRVAGLLHRDAVADPEEPRKGLCPALAQAAQEDLAVVLHSYVRRPAEHGAQAFYRVAAGGERLA